MWGRCCVTGFLYDFDIYQGKGGANEQKGKNQLGVGGDIVVKLCDSLAEKVSFLIFDDNFFTSMPLIEKLLEENLLLILESTTKELFEKTACQSAP